MLTAIVWWLVSFAWCASPEVATSMIVVDLAQPGVSDPVQFYYDQFESGLVQRHGSKPANADLDLYLKELEASIERMIQSEFTTGETNGLTRLPDEETRIAAFNNYGPMFQAKDRIERVYRIAEAPSDECTPSPTAWAPPVPTKPVEQRVEIPSTNRFQRDLPHVLAGLPTPTDELKEGVDEDAHYRRWVQMVWDRFSADATTLPAMRDALLAFGCGEVASLRGLRVHLISSFMQERSSGIANGALPTSEDEAKKLQTKLADDSDRLPRQIEALDRFCTEAGEPILRAAESVPSGADPRDVASLAETRNGLVKTLRMKQDALEYRPSDCDEQWARFDGVALAKELDDEYFRRSGQVRSTEALQTYLRSEGVPPGEILTLTEGEPRPGDVGIAVATARIASAHQKRLTWERAQLEEDIRYIKKKFGDLIEIAKAGTPQ